MPSEHYMTWEAYEQLDEIPRWVEAHSVTCALCGELADERETVSLWNDESSPLFHDDNVDLEEYPNGEAHKSCWQNRD